jgi:hypothetical protein
VPLVRSRLRDQVHSPGELLTLKPLLQTPSMPTPPLALEVMPVPMLSRTTATELRSASFSFRLPLRLRGFELVMEEVERGDRLSSDADELQIAQGFIGQPFKHRFHFHFI